ncbi:putative redox protein, regulator of disulfide bond formation [Hoeflea phototrophica DFL-43]|uniref:Putative redox protein, regulator of disulfide bond formation n=1 Tax=Hoeflea phototrophica (strain DSM 17068 / NCIMB 14078 / DFL-43) TaxID=411684 RepID=A9D814_HOEPD|nr:sulfurtransferase TusA family protein [Hoeflea phototrophica]EDQ33197.1 putative redox protein, regulator of disulfide bond formation [Hoeflea phototrophica DFL-43]
MSGSETETLDLRGLKCPLPVLRTRKHLRGLAGGARIRIETTDPLAVIDIPHFCREDGHQLVATDAMEGGHAFIIEKAVVEKT